MRKYVSLKKCGPYWYLFDFEDFGLCRSHAIRKDEHHTMIKLKFRHPTLYKKWNGKHSRKHQPKKIIRGGWYDTYMQKEWGVDHGHRPRWLDKMIRRIENENRN